MLNQGEVRKFLKKKKMSFMVKRVLFFFFYFISLFDLLSKHYITKILTNKQTIISHDNIQQKAIEGYVCSVIDTQLIVILYILYILTRCLLYVTIINLASLAMVYETHYWNECMTI